MSGTLEITRRFTVRNGDQVLMDYGTITVPIATGCAGVPIQNPTTITLAAGASLKLYDWTVSGDFVAFFLECSGFAWLAQKVDKPTASDGSNNAAAGTDVNYPKTELSCAGPYILQGMAVPVVPSSTNYASAAFHGTTEAGRRYEIWVKNPGTSPVNITYGWTL